MLARSGYRPGRAFVLPALATGPIWPERKRSEMKSLVFLLLAVLLVSVAAPSLLAVTRAQAWIDWDPPKANVIQSAGVQIAWIDWDPPKASAPKVSASTFSA